MQSDTHWPGQGVELAIKHPDWQDERRPFTQTSLGDDAVLEFTIKCYPEGDGVTRQLHRLHVVAELLLNEPFGSMGYQRLLVLNQAARSVIEEVRGEHPESGETPALVLLKQKAATGDAVTA